MWNCNLSCSCSSCCSWSSVGRRWWLSCAHWVSLEPRKCFLCSHYCLLACSRSHCCLRCGKTRQFSPLLGAALHSVHCCWSQRNNPVTIKNNTFLENQALTCHFTCCHLHGHCCSGVVSSGLWSCCKERGVFAPLLPSPLPGYRHMRHLHWGNQVKKQDTK